MLDHHDDVNRRAASSDAARTGRCEGVVGGEPVDVSLADDAVSAFLHAPVAVAVCAATGEVTRLNPAMTHLLGYGAEELLGRDLFRLVEESLVEAAVAACTALRTGSARTVVHETRFRRADGRLIDVRVTTSAVRSAVTATPHAIMHLEDISEQEELRRRLQHQATHDPLTGLANRAVFIEELHRALSGGERHHRPVTVLYLDLDRFKEVNDTHGHAVGDRVLVAFARHLQTLLRPQDLAVRLGGDEFAVLCEDTTSGQASDIASRLADPPRRSADGHGASGGAHPDTWPDVPVGVTVGIATSPDATGRFLGLEELLHTADAAMYAAKVRPGR